MRVAVERITGTAVMALVVTAHLVTPGQVAAQSANPYELSKYREWSLSIAGAGLLAAGLVVQGNQEPLTQDEIEELDPNDVNSFDRSATEEWSTGADMASDLLVLTLIASPAVMAVAESQSGGRLTLGVMYAETILLNNGVVQLLKGVTERTRPFAYNDDPEIPQEKKEQTNTRRSFPSGHTANAFAAAVFLGSTYSKLHPESSARKWIWAGSLTAATAVGYFRYKAGKHFPTDIITGAAIGAAFGYIVPKLHETGVVYVSPVEGGAALGTVLRF
ncbi:MAG: phosphatase PAP2 family protein [Gemmatimonadota bacterium]|nr:MAG: phosphatase PAP2 family protein [Gemmatimonadota bacterium]